MARVPKNPISAKTKSKSLAGSYLIGFSQLVYMGGAFFLGALAWHGASRLAQRFFEKDTK